MKQHCVFFPLHFTILADDDRLTDDFSSLTDSADTIGDATDVTICALWRRCFGGLGASCFCDDTALPLRPPAPLSMPMDVSTMSVAIDVLAALSESKPRGGAGNAAMAAATWCVFATALSSANGIVSA